MQAEFKKASSSKGIYSEVSTDKIQNEVFTHKIFSGLDKASKCRFPASRGVYELVLDEACVELKTFAV